MCDNDKTLVIWFKNHIAKINIKIDITEIRDQQPLNQTALRTKKTISPTKVRSLEACRVILNKATAAII